MENTYWNHKGTHKWKLSRIQKLIPDSGNCDASSPSLEAFRKAANAYYDHYNNGGCNLGKSVRRIFGVKPGDFSDAASAQIESVMDGLIEAAYADQFPRKSK